MWNLNTNKSESPRPLYVNSGGVFATLFLPFFAAIILSIGFFGFVRTILQEEFAAEVSNITAVLTLALLIVPIILALSVGMYFSLKDVSKKLYTASKTKRVHFGTILGSWLSSLSKVHLIYLSFYLCLGLIWLLTIQLFPQDPALIEAFEQLGLPPQASLTLVIFIGLLTYLLLFGGMAYICVTLPLAFVSAIIFKLSSRKSIAV